MHNLVRFVVIALLLGFALSAFQIVRTPHPNPPPLHYHSIRYGDGFSVHCATLTDHYCGMRISNCQDPETEIYCAHNVRVEK